MPQHLPVDVVTALELLDHHVLGMVLALLPQHRFVQVGIEGRTFGLDPRDAVVSQNRLELLVDQPNAL